MLDSFPRVIQAELDRLRENQQWLADKLGLSHASVSNWLRGERKPSAKSLEAVARVFGRTPSWIYEQMEQLDFAAVPADPIAAEPVEMSPHPFTNEVTRETDMTRVLQRDACESCHGTGVKRPGEAA